VIHDTVRIHGFAKRIHVFTNLLYESRNLSKYERRNGSVLTKEGNKHIRIALSEKLEEKKVFSILNYLMFQRTVSGTVAPVV
jgi:hypothetical protein